MQDHYDAKVTMLSGNLKVEVRNGQVYVNDLLYRPAALDEDDRRRVEGPRKGPHQLTLDGDGTLYGDIHGDLDVNYPNGGFMLVVTGNVGGGITMPGAGCKVIVNGQVGGNIHAGGVVEVAQGDVHGDVSAGLGCTVKGKVTGNVQSGGPVNIGGKVGGQVTTGRSR